MTDPAAAAPPRSSTAPWIDTLCVALAALLLYAAFGTGGFRRDDSVTFYMQLAHGHDVHALHQLYLPLVSAASSALTALGLSLFRAMVLASSLGVAAGVAFAHRAAFRLGAGRRHALAFAAWLAVLPAVFHFATTIEVHGVFFAFAGLAFWTTTRYVARPSAWRALGIGLATGLAACVHATGHLLPIAAAAFALGAGVPFRRRLLGHGVAGALGHAAGFAGTLYVTLGVGPLGRPESAQKFARQLEELPRPEVAYVLRTLWHEWAWPFLPLSVLALVALAVARTRRQAIALHAAWLPYLFVTHLMLRGGFVENGAYALPLAFPAAWLGVELCRGIRWPAAIALGLVTLLAAIAQREHPLEHGPGSATPQEVLELVGDDGVVVLGDHELADRVLLARPGAIAFRLDALRMTFLTQEVAKFDEAVAQFTAAGRPVYFDLAAIERMEAEGDSFLDHLRARYDFELVANGSFRAVLLRAR